MMLEPERAATLVAERLRRPALERLAAWGPREGAEDRPARSAGAGVAHGTGGRGGRDWLVRRTLEELGIHCEATSEMQDLKGFLIASPRGAEILVSDRLGQTSGWRCTP